MKFYFFSVIFLFLTLIIKLNCDIFVQTVNATGEDGFFYLSLLIEDDDKRYVEILIPLVRSIVLKKDIFGESSEIFKLLILKGDSKLFPGFNEDCIFRILEHNLSKYDLVDYVILEQDIEILLDKDTTLTFVLGKNGRNYSLTQAQI